MDIHPRTYIEIDTHTHTSDSHSHVWVWVCGCGYVYLKLIQLFLSLSFSHVPSHTYTAEYMGCVDLSIPPLSDDKVAYFEKVLWFRFFLLLSHF